MYRLKKQGITRETVSRVEADALLRCGYTLEGPGAAMGTSTDLQELNIKALYQMCKARGLEIPKGSKKGDLIALLGGGGGDDPE